MAMLTELDTDVLFPKSATEGMVALGAFAMLSFWQLWLTGVTILVSNWLFWLFWTRRERGYLLFKPKPIATANPRRDSKPASRKVGNAVTAVLAEYKLLGCLLESENDDGPVLTRHAIRLPAGTKWSSIPKEEDISMGLGLGKKFVMISAGEGRNLLNIDVPKATREAVDFDKLMVEFDKLLKQEWTPQRINQELPVCPAVTIDGKPYVFTLREAVHLFIAGTTGAGKSVFANAILLSLIQSGAKFHLMIGDGKDRNGDFAPYYGNSKHLLRRDDVMGLAIETPDIAAQIEWLVKEMDNRYSGESTDTTPIVLVIDELADVVGLVGNKIEALLQRLSQKARAVNIFLIPCTQSPNSEIFGQTFRATMPSAIGLKTKTGAQSKVVIEEVGCEKLLGKGDALVKIGADLVRAHGALVTAQHLTTRVV
jgi:DNA segregation ATPase FtsK/SpoIIIE and related proteins